MPCRVCGSSNIKKVFNHQILHKYIIDYFLCSDCGFMQTENPYWLNEAYVDSINISDTGYAIRNLNLSKRTWLLFIILFGKNKKYLDYAGGYGLFTRFMRDFGMDFYTADKYTKNLFAKGFEYENQKISAISCSECFEHFSEPKDEIEKMLSISKNIFFSTNLFGESKVPDDSWWYYGFEHGQHISFYSYKTLEYLAKKNNLFLCSNKKTLHMFLEKKISNYYFLFLVKLGILPWDLFFRFFTKSKTWSDYGLLRNK